MRDSRSKRLLVSIYEFFYEKRRILYLRMKFHLKIMSPDRTLRYIQKHHCSIARYGDGEFDLITKVRDQKFQCGSDQIAQQLLDTLKNDNKKLLICVPRCFNTIKGCNQHAASFWIEWGRKNNHHQEIVQFIRRQTGKNYLFGDSQITRPYIDWKTSDRAKRTFPKLKRLWEDRDILIIEGDKTRLGIGNDLFSNAKSIKRILAPAIGAFERITDIEKAVIDHYNGQLILMALGPTATILAARFADKGIQALDIGNIDIEYEWFLQGATERVAITGKFTTEAKDGINCSECIDPVYINQIITRIQVEEKEITCP